VPSKAEKLLERLSQTSRGFSDRDLWTILTSKGFRSREGNHTVYEHSEHPDLVTVIPQGRELHPKYAKWVKGLLVELARRQAPNEGGEK
jgi:hypothetical protein